MGTSKGYIAPTRIPWTKAKYAVTYMLRNLNPNAVAKVGSKFASAMKADAENGRTFPKAASGIIGFAKNFQNHGLAYALEQIHRMDLIGKPSLEVWDELFHAYTNSGATVEDALAADALSLALGNLDIVSLEQLSEISLEVLLKEMLICFVIVNFGFRFAEKIGKGRSPADANHIIEEMQAYIRNSLYEGLSFKDIENVDFTSLAGNDYIESALIDAYSVFEDIYLEE